MTRDTTEVSVEIHSETDKAVLVSDTGMKANGVWLPKSKIEIERKNGSNIATIILPEWLAIEKGLL